MMARGCATSAASQRKSSCAVRYFSRMQMKAEMEAEGRESSAHIVVFEWSAKETEVEARIQN